jgi:membrane associated rhomboid family serine protease
MKRLSVEGHPWVAGLYFGAVMFLLVAFFLPWALGSPADLKSRLVVGTIALGLSVALIPVLTKNRRLYERSRPEGYPTPTPLRMWTRVSDRFLNLFLLLGIASLVVNASDVFTHSIPAWSAILGLAIAAWLIWTTTAERRRRRKPPNVTS